MSADNVVAVAATDLLDAIRADDRGIAELAQLVAIPSVSVAPSDPAAMRAAAVKTAGILQAAGFATIEILEEPGINPAVFAESPGLPGAPTLLFYGHYDVQPPGNAGLWHA